MSDLPTDEYLIYRITMDVSIPVYKVDKDGNPEEPACAMDYIRTDWKHTEATLLGSQEERLSVSPYKEASLPDCEICGLVHLDDIECIEGDEFLRDKYEEVE